MMHLKKNKNRLKISGLKVQLLIHLELQSVGVLVIGG